MNAAFPSGFLWGAATAAHQVEGNNLNNDWWELEKVAEGYIDASGDALDSYHRFAEDMRLLADSGLTTYRFSLEWSRIEPRPGKFSRAELAHYRRMIDTALDLGLTPFVTLHHFTHPIWFGERGGWLAPDAADVFARYVEVACSILADVPYVCTINEPNVVAMNHGAARIVAAGHAYPATPDPDPEYGDALIAAHRVAAPLVRRLTDAQVGWTVANQAFTPTPGAELEYAEIQHRWEDKYLDAGREDDFIGVQSYTSQAVDENGVVPHPDASTNTLMGWAYRPDALSIAIRHTHDVIGDVPIIVTENGIATDDDERRIEYTRAALEGMKAAMDDGIDVRGYCHWSLLDNFEWGRWKPTFGLIAVDRDTFERRPKPSLAWLGSIAIANAI
ncbi:glycoside hydrolase family 1 protein [Clavibacter michiganensis]|uniref:glycoside hydrolase family 1 protein n=1 Tax=Clavibacter michiganensis TaxID=28447 RepID=UPI000A38DB95|nr:family 1 glycosylhydrolase [Clavibacter michiganensis]MDO4033248.1 family 1 glycosylhydrolase [Clavibacter michiganensis]MDO4082592.1 family 1 glycosylhydrolase [Clavibacter michiganensis]MDO4088265.1 family 1 glycosylhydrolase [Clavibacter michiganensis]MDO4097932.1 family 1 glycosylhydrolase [Clavibacter michiganensis]MWJ05047.1 glycoside hydrolase family 1 protein [Clavibacter michiganensis subsp. michiganensis]